MWDLKKTIAHAASVRRRIEKGLPPFTMTPEEREMMDAFHQDVAEARGGRPKREY